MGKISRKSLMMLCIFIITGMDFQKYFYDENNNLYNPAVRVAEVSPNIVSLSNKNILKVLKSS